MRPSAIQCAPKARHRGTWFPKVRKRRQRAPTPRAGPVDLASTTSAETGGHLDNPMLGRVRHRRRAAPPHVQAASPPHLISETPVSNALPKLAPRSRGSRTRKQICRTFAGPWTAPGGDHDRDRTPPAVRQEPLQHGTEGNPKRDGRESEDRHTTAGLSLPAL